MKTLPFVRIILAALTLSSLVASGAAQTANLEKSVRAHMEFLASDAMRGRGSGTEDELRAGVYFGSLMESYGVEPAGDEDATGRKTFLQTIETVRRPVTSATLSYPSGRLESGRQFVVLRMTGFFKGPLKKIAIDGAPDPGSVALVRWRTAEDRQGVMQKLQALSKAGASGIIVEETEQWRSQWQNLTSRPLALSSTEGIVPENLNVIVVDKESAGALSALVDGTEIEFAGTLGDPIVRRTWNAVGRIVGRDPKLRSETVLLSAHMDHLGVRPAAPGPDKIFNGADDDASGCTAVIELARQLARGPRPRRTVYFAFFGSEEAGGTGSQYFVGTLPFPKEKLVANLQFEMLGRPDEKVKPGELWLTGYERSDLGVTLAGRGAKLVADPHPDQNFFQRSDNYTLARKGIVAHTVSSFGLHKDYHQASDESATIDFRHLTVSIASMFGPVQWLLNSGFRPSWYEGKRP